TGAIGNALRLLDPKAGAALGALVDDAASTSVDLAALKTLLSEASRARGVSDVPLLALGLLANGGRAGRVRVERGAWETIWRNLFANALEAGGGSAGRLPRLAISAADARDPITGQRVL